MELYAMFRDQNTLIILRLETFPNLINKVDAIPIGFSKKLNLKHS